MNVQYKYYSLQIITENMAEVPTSTIFSFSKQLSESTLASAEGTKILNSLTYLFFIPDSLRIHVFLSRDTKNCRKVPLGKILEVEEKRCRGRNSSTNVP